MVHKKNRQTDDAVTSIYLFFLFVDSSLLSTDPFFSIPNCLCATVCQYHLLIYYPGNGFAMGERGRVGEWTNGVFFHRKRSTVGPASVQFMCWVLYHGHWIDLESGFRPGPFCRRCAHALRVIALHIRITELRIRRE